MSEINSPSGMIEPDLLVATSGPEGNIYSRNAAWISVFGNEEDLWTRLLPEDAETARQNLGEASRGSLVTHALFLVSRQDRDLPTPVLLHFVPVGGTQGSALVSVAISGEILAEPSSWTESQTQRHRMETLGRMTMGMAHDFNNLLGGILGHVELWRHEGHQSSEEHLDTIEQAARDGAELIGKIQRYIRQEARSTFEHIDLTALVSECISFTKPYWFNEPRRQGIDIDVQSTLGELPSIEGSAPELRDVFVNLILNAVYALNAGGSISFSGHSEAGSVYVLVTDTGTGMSSEVQKHVFEPLYSTKGERGTGMGLAVAAGIMREHGGAISVSSALGKGTTFTLSFPIQANIEETKPDPVPTSKTAESRSVLVVDDEEMVLNVISRLLSIRGHNVTKASSGQEALTYFDKSSFDIVITDQGMPEMSGRELAFQIRKEQPDLPIILLTGDTDLSVDSQTINQVMTKPFRIDAVEAAIVALT
jgi:signal transduction histidine kinase